MTARRCRVGKPCGATCITRSKICRKDFISEMSDDVGKFRDSVQSRGSGGSESRRLPEEAREQYQKDFLDHVERNSAGYSTATFQPRDLANLLVQASNDLEGEAKENLKRLMDFVVKDDQVLFVSTRETPKEIRDVKTIKKFVDLLEKSYPPLRLDYEVKLGRIRSLVKEMRDKIKQDQERVKNGQMPMWKERISRIRNKELKELADQLKEAREKIFAVGVTRTDNPNNWGFTNRTSRRVVVTDRSNIPSDRFVVGERADAKLAAKQVRETMEFRAGKQKLTDEEIHQTKFVVGRFGEGKTTSAYLHVYIHELGHQIHYRSGEPLPPKDSVSLSRGSTLAESNKGISKYSTVNHQETFAEAFAAFVLNPKALRENDEPLYNWVRSNFETAIERVGAPIPAW